jgi:hypothetical protein
MYDKFINKATFVYQKLSYLFVILAKILINMLENSFNLENLQLTPSYLLPNISSHLSISSSILPIRLLNQKIGGC